MGREVEGLGEGGRVMAFGGATTKLPAAPSISNSCPSARSLLKRQGNQHQARARETLESESLFRA